MFGLKSKLKACRHANQLSPHFYVRKDGAFAMMVAADSHQRRLDYLDDLTGMRVCLDCGATQMFLLGAPWDLMEPWALPHIWGG